MSNRREYWRQYARQYYQDHKRQILEQKREYYQDHKKQRLEYLRDHKEQILERSREQRRQYWQQYEKEYPEKVRAREKARNIPLASYCQKCGSTENLMRHHPDYSKPLQVLTLCKRCDRKEHAKLTG